MIFNESWKAFTCLLYTSSIKAQTEAWGKNKEEMMKSQQSVNLIAGQVDGNYR